LLIFEKYAFISTIETRSEGGKTGMENQLVDRDAPFLTLKKIGQSIGNALARVAGGDGKIFYLQAAGSVPVAFPVLTDGKISGEGTSLPLGEEVEIIHPDNLAVKVKWA
jgi:hypothetical protein